MKKILLEMTVDWEDYDDVCDDLILIDALGELKDGVSIKIIKPIKNIKQNKKITEDDFITVAYMSGFEDGKKSNRNQSKCETCSQPCTVTGFDADDIDAAWDRAVDYCDWGSVPDRESMEKENMKVELVSTGAAFMEKFFNNQRS